MKKILVLLAALFLVVSFSGCTQETKIEPKKQEIKEETIQEILEKGKNVNNIKYDVMLIKPFPITFKVQQKGKKYRTEATLMGQTSVTIFDGEKLYNYDPQEDIYYENPASTTNNGGMDFKDFSEQALKDPEMKETGKETINGMKTRIIEFNYKDRSSNETIKTKAWISEEYGIPVKLQMKSQPGEAEVELKNIQMNSVQDSVFVVPKEKIKSMEDLMKKYNNAMPENEDFNQ
jgi:outer membrane lipoprotein-sorting protein